MKEMTNEDRSALIEKITKQLDVAPDDYLKDLADKMGISDENSFETSATEVVKPPEMDGAKPVVDTGLLTGPIGGLKNFLMKKSMDQQQ
jgi:hypothetical protein